MDIAEAIKHLEWLAKFTNSGENREAFHVAIAAMRGMREQGRSKWISVKERLPKTWEDVLTSRENGYVEVNWLQIEDGWHENEKKESCHPLDATA